MDKQNIKIKKKSNENDINKEIEKIAKKLKECEKLRDEYLEGWKRSRAEFENYKKQELENREANREYLNRDWILRILELYDNLERAEKYIPKEIADNDWVKAVLQIQKQFLQSIDGLEEIPALGKDFDPNKHEAIEQVEEKDSKRSGKIVEVLQKGYLFNNKVIRPSKVKVIK